MEESSGLTEEALAQYDREMADTRGRRFYRRRTRKARRSIVSAMSDNESDSDDEASSDGASPRDNIAQVMGNTCLKLMKLKNQRQGISNARIDAQCAVIPKKSRSHLQRIMPKKVPKKKRKTPPR